MRVQDHISAAHRVTAADAGDGSAPDVSAVVITRNEEATIGRCLASVFDAFAAFPRLRAEVLLVDSASTDRTVERARRHPVRVVILPADAPKRPALGRHVGLAHTRGGLVLFVDGDCVLDRTWLPKALDALEADPRLAGVSGAADAVLPSDPGTTAEIRDQYPDADYDTPAHLSGSALYRRAALEETGGFNPFLYACEETELGARLRKAGYRLARLRARMTQHFPKAQKETVAELLRRCRRRYFVGLGQLARQAISRGLPIERPLRNIDRQLAFFALMTLMTAGGAVWLVHGTPMPMAAALALVATLFAAFVVRTRSLARPAYYFLEWALTSPMVVWGLLARPRSAGEFPSLRVVIDGEAPPARGTSSSTGAREGLLTLLLVIAAFGAAALACELGTRLLRPQVLFRYPRGLYTPASEVGYKFAPGFRGVLSTAEYETSFATNASGLREDREYGPKGPGTFRILLLGDSFTAGIGVEGPETFAKVVERRLGRGVEVINAGIPGYGTREEAILLKREGLALRPDLILLAFFAGNDVFDNASTIRPHVTDGELITGEAGKGILPLGIRGFLSRHSHLYHLALPYVRHLFGRDAWETAERARTFAIYDRPEAPLIAPGWRATDRWLGRVARTARQHGIPIAVVVIPDLLQVDVAAWDARARQVGEGVAYDRRRPAMEVAALLRAYGVPVLDLLPPLETATDAGSLYFGQDGHWTRRGHEIAGADIVDFLGRQGLVPSGTN